MRGMRVSEKVRINASHSPNPALLLPNFGLGPFLPFFPFLPLWVLSADVDDVPVFVLSILPSPDPDPTPTLPSMGVDVVVEVAVSAVM